MNNSTVQYFIIDPQSGLDELVEATFNNLENDLLGKVTAELTISVRGEHYVEILKGDMTSLNSVIFDRKSDADKFIKLVNSQFDEFDGFYAVKDKDIVGENKWSIQNDNYELLDYFLGHKDQLWYTKTEALEQVQFFLQSEEYQIYLKRNEAIDMFHKLDTNGFVDTAYYDTAKYQEDGLCLSTLDELRLADINSVIEYYKTVQQIVELDKKAKGLEIFG